MNESVIISITNQKGGEGKTTTAINLAHSLSRRNYKTLLVDMDPQSNATSAFVELKSGDKSLIDIFNGKALFKDVVKPTGIENLHILPSRITLAEFESNNSNIDAPYILRDCLAEDVDYDYMIIDCPPSLSIFTINALVASKYVIVPLQAEKFSMDGIQGLQKTITQIKKRINPDIQILGALITQVKPKTVLNKTIMPVIQKFFTVFNSSITDGVVVGESHLARQSIYDYNKNSKQSQEYEEFAEEVIRNVKKG